MVPAAEGKLCFSVGDLQRAFNLWGPRQKHEETQAVALASKSQTWRPRSMCCSQPAMCVELSWVRNSPTSIHTLCSATPQDHGTIPLSGCGFWGSCLAMGISPGLDSGPKAATRYTLRIPLALGMCKAVLICLSCGRRPHPQRSPIFSGGRGEQPAKENRAKDAGRGRPDGAV